MGCAVGVYLLLKLNISNLADKYFCATSQHVKSKNMHMKQEFTAGVSYKKNGHTFVPSRTKTLMRPQGPTRSLAPTPQVQLAARSVAERFQASGEARSRATTTGLCDASLCSASSKRVRLLAPRPGGSKSCFCIWHINNFAKSKAKEPIFNLETDVSHGWRTPSIVLSRLLSKTEQMC